MVQELFMTSKELDIYKKLNTVKQQRDYEKYCILKKIRELKQQLEKYKEDVEQVELFNMSREDYQAKKQLCIDIILKLRKLEERLKYIENEEKLEKGFYL